MSQAKNYKSLNLDSGDGMKMKRQMQEMFERERVEIWEGGTGSDLLNFRWRWTIKCEEVPMTVDLSSKT